MVWLGAIVSPGAMAMAAWLGAAERAADVAVCGVAQAAIPSGAMASAAATIQRRRFRAVGDVYAACVSVMGCPWLGGRQAAWVETSEA
jgi:hypothetical protein